MLPGASFTNFVDPGSNGNGRVCPFYNAPAGNPLGIPAGNYLVDTGAPFTAAPGSALAGGAGSPGLLGTNILNQYGQYYDFTNNTLMLFAPTAASNQNIVGPGILFTVGRSTTGLANTGVNQLATNGSLPVNNSNNTGAAIAGDGIAGPTGLCDLQHSADAALK